MPPGETGVIDLVGFLKALKSTGYDGPVTPEPFSEKVSRMKPEDAVKVTGEALKRIREKPACLTETLHKP